MSSWRKAAKINQTTHRERHQPKARKSLGLLEKHSDYKKRANDFQKKRDTIALLRKRALNRNPDEFYHHMINSKVDNGQHRENKKDENTEDQMKLMRSQDLKYITYKRTIEANKIKKLQAQLHMINVPSTIENQHTFFVDTEEEMNSFDLVKRLDTHPDLLDHKANRPRLSALKNLELNSPSDFNTKAQLKNYNELKKRILREKELTVVQQKLELKNHLKGKGRKPKKLLPGSTGSRAVYVWNYERKK